MNGKTDLNKRTQRCAEDVAKRDSIMEDRVKSSNMYDQGSGKKIKRQYLKK